MALEPQLSLQQTTEQGYGVSQRMVEWSQGGFGALAGFVLGVLGALGMPLVALLVLMGLDVASGVLAGWANEGVSSRVGRKGVARKGLTLLVLFGLAVLQQISFNDAVPAAQAVAGWFCVMELLSIVENAKLAGVGGPVVELLVQMLRVRVEPPKPPNGQPPATPAFG